MLGEIKHCELLALQDTIFEKKKKIKLCFNKKYRCVSQPTRRYQAIRVRVINFKINIELLTEDII